MEDLIIILQQLSSKTNTNKSTLLALLLSIPFIAFILLALSEEYFNGISNFLEIFLPLPPNGTVTIAGLIISILFLFSVFWLCCLSSFLYGKTIAKKNKYFYLTKITMSVFWFIGIASILFILGITTIIEDGIYHISLILGCTYSGLIIKIIVDTIRFIIYIIKNRKHKPSK